MHNPASDERNGDEIYSEIIEFVYFRFEQILKKEPYLESSNRYGECYDESFTFVFEFDMDIESVKNFIEITNQISDDIINKSFV